MSERLTSENGASVGTFVGTANANERRAVTMRGNSNAEKSGHWALKSRLKQHGFDALSPKMLERVQEWRDSIVSDLGGNENLSELQQDLVDRYLHTSVLIDSLNQWLSKEMTKPPKNGKHALINQRQRTVYPILLERNRIIETSLKIASALGLERRSKPVQSLQDYLGEKPQETESSKPEAAP